MIDPQGTLMKATLISLALFALPMLVFAGDAPPQPLVTDAAYTHADRLVDIGDGQRLNLHCVGEGSPAVVLDAGMGDSSIAWALVQPAIGRLTRVCAFDRAGLGFSDAARRASTPVNQSEDLHRLLHAAHIKPPYVMVGHSMAGMNVRVYADKYFDEVSGLVIVEGSHEDQSIRGWAIGAPGQKDRWDAYLKDTHACIAAAQQGLGKGSPLFAKCVGDTNDPRFSAAINAAQASYAVTPRWQAAVASERENVFYESANEVRATRKDFGDKPIIVLTHSPYPRKTDETQDERNAQTLLWEDLHNQVAGMSTRGINIIVPHAGHYIQYDKPQVVIDAIAQAVWLARGGAATRQP